jgi:hypothetical protein
MMNFFCRTSQVQWMRCAAGVILISALTGCKRDETKVYHVVVEQSPQTQPAPVPPEMVTRQQQLAAFPQLKYQLPADWQEKPPGEMRVASFTALGPGGQSADVSIIPLPIAGRDLELINMWRAQVQLPATSDPDAVKQAEAVAIGAEQGRLFDFVSEQLMIGHAHQRILVAMLTRGTLSWFFKIAGEDAFVASQKQNFLRFLKSISFGEIGLMPMAVAPATNNENDKADSIWTIPPNWQSLPPSQFLLAEFAITGANGAKAEVNVAEMGGEGGGLTANVNRWRRQLGLQPSSEILATPLDFAGGTAQIVDFTGTDSKTGQAARLVGAIVPQNGQTWFYKLMGNGPIVAQQKDAFIKFIQSAKYANGRNVP